MLMNEQRHHSELASDQETESATKAHPAACSAPLAQHAEGDDRIGESIAEISRRSPVGIYVAQDGRLCFVSPQLQKDTGLGPDALLGESPLCFVLPEDRDAVRHDAGSMSEGTRSQPYEYRLVAPDGCTKWVLEAVTPVHYRGRPAALGCYLDITGRKRREERLADDRIQLEEVLRDLAAKLEAAEERANTDGLTGLQNHRSFHDRLGEEIARCCRFAGVFTLILVDVDHFKAYNDANGHLAGDGLLQNLAQMMSRSGRTIDIAFRYGGDEFAILLPGTPPDGGFVLAERIRQRVQVETNTETVPQTCSFGIASWPADGSTREEIIRAADTALYRAKQNGRNQVCLAWRDGTSGDDGYKDNSTAATLERKHQEIPPTAEERLSKEERESRRGMTDVLATDVSGPLKRAFPTVTKLLSARVDARTLARRNRGSTTAWQGHCLGCGQSVPYDTTRPYCHDCQNAWGKTGNPNRQETFCHACGRFAPISMARPRCPSCIAESK
jgi:diguanylate cyclase (GGDEF)-like protein/PAS domain S-box-containing protein